MQHKIEWKRSTGRHASGETAWIGKVFVGFYHDAMTTKGDPSAYDIHCNLPGITPKLGTTRFATTEAAKARVEQMVATWFRWLGEQ